MAKDRAKRLLARQAKHVETTAVAAEKEPQGRIPLAEIRALYADSPNALKEAILADQWRKRQMSPVDEIGRLAKRSPHAHAPAEPAKRPGAVRERVRLATAPLSTDQALRLRRRYPFLCALLIELQRSAV